MDELQHAVIPWDGYDADCDTCVQQLIKLTDGKHVPLWRRCVHLSEGDAEFLDALLAMPPAPQRDV